MAKQKEVFVQIGVTALRNPDGTFHPSVPMYIKVNAEDVKEETGLTQGEETALQDVSGIFADMYRQYMNAGGMRAGK